MRDARLIVIAVEGEREEPWYFDHLVERDLVDNRRVRLVVLPTTNGLSAPEHVANRLTVFEESNDLITDDERWLVIDVDRHHNLQAVLREAHQKGWRFAVSNPCFEVWLQIHLREVAEGTHSEQAKRAWRVLRNDMGPSWFFERRHVLDACTRGDANDLWVPDAPGTTVHRLVSSIVH